MGDVIDISVGRDRIEVEDVVLFRADPELRKFAGDVVGLIREEVASADCISDNEFLSMIFSGMYPRDFDDSKVRECARNVLRECVKLRADHAPEMNLLQLYDDSMRFSQ